MKKFGGSGRKKQACVNRKCLGQVSQTQDENKSSKLSSPCSLTVVKHTVHSGMCIMNRYIENASGMSQGNSHTGSTTKSGIVLKVATSHKFILKALYTTILIFVVCFHLDERRKVLSEWPHCLPS